MHLLMKLTYIFQTDIGDEALSLTLITMMSNESVLTSTETYSIHVITCRVIYAIPATTFPAGHSKMSRQTL